MVMPAVAEDKVGPPRGAAGCIMGLPAIHVEITASDAEVMVVGQARRVAFGAKNVAARRMLMPATTMRRLRWGEMCFIWNDRSGMV